MFLNAGGSNGKMCYCSGRALDFVWAVSDDSLQGFKENVTLWHDSLQGRKKIIRLSYDSLQGFKETV